MYLSRLQEAMVLDLGGTASDVGDLRNEFSREANGVAKVGGVRALFRTLDPTSSR